MSNKAFTDLLSKSEQELRTELVSVQRALFGVRVGYANQATENTAAIRKLRKEIARIKTLLRQRQLGIEVKVAKESKSKDDTKTKKSEAKAKAKAEPKAKPKAKTEAKPKADKAEAKAKDKDKS